MNRLGVEYIDLFLIHWPEVSSKCEDKWKTLADTWRAMESLYEEGLCRAIGVSNYGLKEFEHLLDECSVIPHINQIEFHPYHNPIALRHFCDDHNIQVQGYCPLGNGHLVDEQVIKEIALRHSKTPAQVLIRWSVQNRVPTIPKSTKEKRVKENFDVFDFKLTEPEMILLNGLHDGRKFIDGSQIKNKIDDHLPDGYRLGIVNDHTYNSNRGAS